MLGTPVVVDAHSSQESLSVADAAAPADAERKADMEPREERND